jgi:hypothetical protein
MPTIEDCQNSAPNIMQLGDFTVSQIENKIASRPKVENSSVVDVNGVDQSIVVDIFDEIFSFQDIDRAVSAAGGFKRLGAKHGISKKQAKLIVEELENLVDLFTE